VPKEILNGKAITCLFVDASDGLMKLLCVVLSPISDTFLYSFASGLQR